MATTKVTTDVIDMSGNAGGLTWVTGTTAQQPSGVIGEIREDTDTNRTLVYTDETGTAEWRNLKETAVTLPTFNVHFLVIAGGASGAAWHGGGGGAGGYRTSYGTVSPITLNGGTMESVLALSLSTNYTITVGLGGGGVGSNGPNIPGNAGSNSVFSGSDITDVTSTGGGFGTSIISGTPAAGSGGSGGGGNNTAGGAAVTTPVIQGHAGGTGSGAAGNSYSSGGGGGAKLVGGNFSGNTSGSGGDGLENQITGATGIFYAGGGGGGVYTGGFPGTGGSSVGGNGGPNTYSNDGFPGAINTGSGGGGANASAPQTTGSGGSGIVILRCTKATATLGSGITVNSTAGPGSVNGVLISGTSDYHYSATAGTGTITFS